MEGHGFERRCKYIKEIDGVIYPRTIPDVRTMLQTSDISIDPCSTCDNRKPQNEVPCELYISGMSEVGIGVMCMDKKVQITGSRMQEINLQLPSVDGNEILILDRVSDSEIE